MTLTRENILQTVERNATELRRFGVRKLALFGSFARGDTGHESDLDFLVEFEKKTFDGYMDLKELLEKTFSRKVDLVIADGIKPRLRSTILSEAVHAQGF